MQRVICEASTAPLIFNVVIVVLVVVSTVETQFYNIFCQQEIYCKIGSYCKIEYCV